MSSESAGLFILPFRLSSFSLFVEDEIPGVKKSRSHVLQWFRCYTGDQRALFSVEKLFLTLLSGIFL